jgi:FkbM family methyltransferase
MNRLVRRIGKAVKQSALFRSFNFCWRASMRGRRVKIPVIRGMFITFLSEMWMLDLLDRLLRVRRGAFVDIGTNVGQTLLKVKCVDPGIQYVGLEPNPACVFYIHELIKANGFRNCLIVPVGVFNRDGLVQLEFFSGDATDSCASVIPGYRRSARIHHREVVPVCRFDRLRSELHLSEISIVKIDVEGSEMEVIESLHGTMCSDRPILMVEILPVYSDEMAMRKQRQGRIEKVFSEVDYSLFRVKKGRNDAYGGLEQIETIGVHSDLSRCDYVAVPKELREKIR